MISFCMVLQTRFVQNQIACKTRSRFSFCMVLQNGLCKTGKVLVAWLWSFCISFCMVLQRVSFCKTTKPLLCMGFPFCICCTPIGGYLFATPPPRGSSSALNLPDTRLTNGRSKLKPKGNQRARLMGSIRRVIWKCIWVCSFCTLGITVIYKDGVVIKLESIWGGVAPLPHR